MLIRELLKFKIYVLSVGCLFFMVSCANKGARNNNVELVFEETADTPSKWPEHMVTLEPEITISLFDSMNGELIESDHLNDEMALDIQEKEMTQVSGLVGSPRVMDKEDESVIEEINAIAAASIVRAGKVNSKTLAACFTYSEISPEVYSRMENKSFNEENTIPLSDLSYIRVLHYGFDDEIYVGELVVNQLIASDIVEIFKELFDAKYKIEQMVLIDEYEAHDELSMRANNTSAYNFRAITGSTSLSLHAYGFAIDINPLYNPYVKIKNGETVILPENGEDYANRELDCEYYIKKGDVCYNAFVSRGFSWGGNWITLKDYQHFEKEIK